MSLAAGTKLDGYEILGLLGSGGMGEVYRAKDSALRREVAIKVLPAYVSRDSDRLRRFEQEAQAAAALNHPNILAVHRFGVFEEAPYLVAELLEGSTLRELLRHGALPPRKAIDCGVQIARGLAAAHDRGVVHRDLKPENLFVTKDGHVKILDFGLAKLNQRESGFEGAEPAQTIDTDPGMVMGTAGYMSPEQVRGATVDHRTDIFAFGAILYEMLSGKRAFQRSTSAETMTAILHDEPPSISQMTQAIPPGLQRVVHRCLEKNPGQRFQSASDLAFALEALSDSGSGPAVAVTSQGSRSRWIWVVAAGFAAVLVAALVVWWRIPPAVPVVESVTQLTDDGEPKRDLMSDGSRIYFTEGSPRHWIAQVSVTGGPTARVETRFANYRIAGVTPNGSSLLAQVSDHDFEEPESPLWLIPLPAGEPRRLGGIECVNQDLFPNGRIVFAKETQAEDGKDAGTDLFVADKDGLNPRKLISFKGVVSDLWVEPNGQRILFAERQGNDGTLFDIAADGTGLREIRKFSNERGFMWTPDEKYLLYQSEDANRWDIWALPMKTGLFGNSQGKPVRLTNGPLPYSSAYPSRDGKQIFALGTKQRGELVRFDMKSGQFVTFLSGISATEPAFSSDGKWVAYTSYPDHTLWRSRSDGTERMQLTFPPMEVRFPFISPDGTRIAFSTSQNEIYLVGMDGSRPQRVAEKGLAANWSPDGNLLIFTSMDRTFGARLYDLRSGKVSVVPSSSGTVGAMWVTQNTFVAASMDSNNAMTGFRVFDFKTQKWTDLASISVSEMMISPDRNYLYFTTAGAETKAMRLRFADRKIETITSLKDFHRAIEFGGSPINVAPDGSPIFTHDTGYQEIYALNIRWP